MAVQELSSSDATTSGEFFAIVFMFAQVYAALAHIPRAIGTLLVDRSSSVVSTQVRTGRPALWVGAILIDCAHLLTMRLAFVLLGAASAQKTLSGGNFLEPNSSTANALARGGGNFLYTYTDYATTLKAALLASYDKTVVASSVDRRDDSLDYSGAGTVVKMQVRFFKIDDVDPGTGSMQVKIWLRMRWQDSRLSWEPGQWGNVTELAFNHPKLEEPEIWTPDILPFNARLLMADMFEDTVAAVTYDGQVTWSRAGLLDVMCKFSGLVMFPYDSLQCGIDFGGWMLAGHHQDLTLWGEGFTFDNAEDTSGTSSQEFAIQRITSLVMSYGRRS